MKALVEFEGNQQWEMEAILAASGMNRNVQRLEKLCLTSLAQQSVWSGYAASSPPLAA